MKKVLILLTLVLSIVACSTESSTNNSLALSVATEMATSKETNAVKKQKACLKVFDTKCKEKNKDNTSLCTAELAKTTCETALKK